MSVDTEEQTTAEQTTDAFEERITYLGQRVEQLIRDVSEERRARQRAEMELTAFKERVVEVGGDAAERHDWCSVYENLMAELGLPGRVRSHRVSVRVSFRQDLDVQARTQEEAEDLVSDASVGSGWYPRLPVDSDVAEVAGPAWDVVLDIASDEG